MRALALLLIANLGLAQAVGVVKAPSYFRPVTGPVYVIAHPSFVVPGELSELLATATELRILLEAQRIRWTQNDVERFIRYLPVRPGIPVKYRLHTTYPPLAPSVIGGNWMYLAGGYFTDLVQEVGSYLKVVEDAWNRSSPVR